MGLFKKKEEKKTCDKRIVIAIEIVVAVLLFLTLLGIKWLIVNGDSESNIVTLENQVVSNVSFVDFKIEYIDEQGNVTVSAINYTEEDITANKVEIKLYAEDGSLVSTIKDVVGFSLEPNQEHLISSSIATTSRVSSVEYIVE